MSSQLVQQQKCPQGRKTLPTCANNTFLFANLCTFFIGQCKLFMQQWEKLAHNLMKGEMFADAQSRMVFLPLGPGKWHTVASPLRPLNKLNYATFKHCHRWTRHELSFSFTFSKMIFHRGVITYSSSWICNHLSFSSGAFLISVCLFVCFLVLFVCYLFVCDHLSFSSDAFLISRLFVSLFVCTYVCLFVWLFICLFAITSASPLTPFSSPAPAEVWPPCLASLWFPSPWKHPLNQHSLFRTAFKNVWDTPHCDSHYLKRVYS